MSDSSYRALDRSAFTSNTSWMNLGLWTSTCTSYEDANLALARKLLDFASESNPHTAAVVDLGCGAGEALLIWKQRFERVVGVNQTDAEVVVCRRDERLRGVNVVREDATVFLRKLQWNEPFTVISLDSIYHFAPSRVETFALARRAGAARFAASDIVLSADWARPGEIGVVRRVMRAFAVRLLSFVAGVPMANLRDGPLDFEARFEETGWKLRRMEIITSQVFEPFAKFCKNRVETQKGLSLSHRWTLKTSGWFMGRLGRSGMVEFVLYSADAQ